MFALLTNSSWIKYTVLFTQFTSVWLNGARGDVYATRVRSRLRYARVADQINSEIYFFVRSGERCSAWWLVSGGRGAHACAIYCFFTATDDQLSGTVQRTDMSDTVGAVLARSEDRSVRSAWISAAECVRCDAKLAMVSFPLSERSIRWARGRGAGRGLSRTPAWGGGRARRPPCDGLT